VPTVSTRADPDAGYPTRGRRRILGESGPRVFPVAIGGNAFGWTASEEAAYSVLDAYRELGGNLIDTADSYASGRSESIIGDWMRSRGNRGEIVLTTKIGGDPEHNDRQAGPVSAAIEASLARLRTDYVDVLFVHLDDESNPCEEILVEVDENVRRGTVRAVGVVDHSANRVLEARIIAAQMGLSPLTALQCRYNLMHRTEFEGALANLADQQSLGVMPRFALDGGFLAGNYRTKSELDLNSTGNIVLGGDAEKHLNRRGQRILATVDRIAEEQDCAPATVSIAWILTKNSVTAPIVGASNASQVAELVAAADISLTRQQVAALDDVSA
jgi:aryl-alcohol dehydrogenase-like predicted oxidoreductase